MSPVETVFSLKRCEERSQHSFAAYLLLPACLYGCVGGARTRGI